jgi:hypothetical protein
MPDRQLHLDFLGAPLAIDGRPDWLDALATTFAPFVTRGPAASAPFSLALQEVEALDGPPDLELTWDGILPEGQRSKIYESDDEAVQYVEDSARLYINHVSGHSHAQLLPGAWRHFHLLSIYLVVTAALARNGLHLLHAACLTHDESGRELLIFVKSGGGKTTTSLSLAHNGFTLSTDDASVLIEGKTPPQVWGIPRGMKVHFNTARLLPWLGDFRDEWNSFGEQAVALAQLGGLIGMVDHPRPNALGAIVFLGERSAGDHVLRPMPKGEALVAIAHDNVAWRPAGMTNRAQERFSALADMVASVPTYELSAGENLDALPAVIADAMMHPQGKEPAS